MIVDLNVGGVLVTTTVATLTRDKNSGLAGYFIAACDPENPTPAKSESSATLADAIIRESPNRFFIDRDGLLFRYVLDYLRTGKLFLPDNFNEFKRLREEGRFYKLPDFLKQLKSLSPVEKNQLNSNANGPEASLLQESGYVSVGYRGTFAFGRDGQADVKFRKINRILICGKYQLCREVFGDTLNESRDPDRGGEGRYTARLYLKHTFLEMAFDMLTDCGFKLISACASGTSGGTDLIRSGTDGEEQRWNHYNEFIFYRPPPNQLDST